MPVSPHESRSHVLSYIAIEFFYEIELRGKKIDENVPVVLDY